MKFSASKKHSSLWQKIKNALISETMTDPELQLESDTNTDQKIKTKKKYSFDLINTWLQFCISHDKQMKHFFEMVGEIVVLSIAEHFPVLQQKRKQLTYKDEYGILQDDGWFKEITRFRNSIILPRLELLKQAPFTLHETLLKAFACLYNAMLPNEKPLNAQINNYYGFVVDDIDALQDNLADLHDIFLEHEQYAKTHKNNKKCQKFLSLKKHQMIIKNSDYIRSFRAHFSLPDLFCCLLHIPDAKNSEFALVWTSESCYFVQQTIGLEKLLYEYTINYPNPYTISPEDFSKKTYEFLFETWLEYNIALLFNIIFSEDSAINQEQVLMKYHSQKFGNKKASKTQIPKTGLEYEKIITAKLKELGFNAKTTKASGDQGADVLADKDDVSFAIQCKMYTKPVGNKAVQEVNTARDFYKKDYAVVVSNAGYTKSARTAANACDVILINDTQLEKLLEYV